MRTIALSSCLFLCLALSALSAQAPHEVPIRNEPNHHLVLDNAYVNVFRVSFPGHAASLIHQHDVPYLYVSLGPADIMNAIQGRPELHQVLADGQVGYSPGHFAHLVRTDAGIPFNNVTIELLKPQGEIRNRCDKITEGPLHDCEKPSPAAAANSPMTALGRAISIRPLFETDELLATSYAITLKQTYTETDSPGGTPRPRLLIVQMGSEVRAEVEGETPKIVDGGEAMWLDGAKSWKLFLPGGKSATRFVLIAFR